MLLERKNFEFGKFLLISKEKTLLHDGKPVPLTPKTYLLLHTLVQNHGHLVERERLISTLWPDSFVEEGNLSYTVALLRKALGDNRNGLRFIETAPKHGYRFVAEVVEVEETAVSENSDRAPQPALRGGRSYFLKLSAAALTGFFVIGTFVIASRYSGGSSVETVVLASPLTSQKLAASGSAQHAVVSGDGSHVVFVESRGERESVWLRQTETSNSTEVLPPSDDVYGGLALSPDNKNLYFTRIPKGLDRQFDVFRIPLLGGVPVKIISGTQGWIDVSLDGNMISFVRCEYRDDEFCSLWIADSADGKNEKKLTSRPRPLRIANNRISPDARSVVFAAGQSENQSNDFAIAEVDIASGVEHEITPERFFNINGLAWLPNGNGLLFTASRIPNKHFRIWQVDKESGSVSPLTKDSDSYTGVTIDRAGTLLVATQVKYDFQLNLFQLGAKPPPSRLLAQVTSADLGDDNKLLFSSIESGNDEIWSMNVDGTGKRQLTSDPADDTGPISSKNRDFVVFSSNRSGEAHVWRMNTDGSLQRRLTMSVGGFPRFVSPDGWVYYLSGRNRSLYRISATGGKEELILDRRINYITFRPDGMAAAFFELNNGVRTLTVSSMPDGLEIKRFPVDSGAKMIGLDWSADGRSIAYVLADAGQSSLWSQQIENDKPVKMADLGDDIAMEQSGFSLSSEGKMFTLGKGGWKYDAVLFTGLK